MRNIAWASEKNKQRGHLEHRIKAVVGTKST